MVKVTVPDGVSCSLEAYLLSELVHAQRSTITRAVRNRDVRRGGVRLGARDTVRAGDVLEVYIADELLAPKRDILYEDGLLLAVNKPAGIPSVGAQSMETIVREHNPQARACHRLDSAACGVLLFALTEDAHGEALRLFRERVIQKKYRCLIKGIPEPEEGELRGYLIKDARRAIVRVEDQPRLGAASISLAYRLLEEREGDALMDIDLHSGRTHQIRAQLAHIGHPILGDDLYGDRIYNRQCRARRLLLESVMLRLSGAKGPLASLEGLTICAPLLDRLMTKEERWEAAK